MKLVKNKGLWLLILLGTGLMLSLIAANSSVQANISPQHKVAQHEWLKPYFIQQDLQESITVAHIKSGDTAGIVLRKLGFPMAEAIHIIHAARPVYALRKLRAGRTFKRQDSQGEIRLSYEVDAEQELQLRYLINQGWTAEMVDRALSTRVVVVDGYIQDSLFLDAGKAGLEDALTMKLVDMFAWDIDFARDLRKGDTFKVMFEETFDDKGKRVHYNILAAEFYNKGQLFTGIRYVNKKGDEEYFSQEGRNLRKTYLKSPVKYSRISSRFSTSRKHPVLGYTRAHRGVDYAAKTGTPIRAIGDGKVVFQGWKGGYGRFVEIKHTNGIHSTAYAHMRRYGKGIRRGKSVKQGQIIGYVGMSGLATGPHLHFEFRTRGRAVNPLRVKHKPAKPVAKEEMTAFRIHAKALIKVMNQQSQIKSWG
ncbi:MAG: M23 family metallopeptidase [Ghiorsea sp.]